MEREEYEYILSDWVPPWIDNGRALKRMIDRATESNLSFDSWLLLSLFISKQLNADMNRVRKQNLNLK